MPKRAVFETSRRELSLDVSVRVHILLVVEQSSLENQSRGCAKTPILMVPPPCMTFRIKPLGTTVKILCTYHPAGTVVIPLSTPKTWPLHSINSCACCWINQIAFIHDVRTVGLFFYQINTCLYTTQIWWTF